MDSKEESGGGDVKEEPGKDDAECYLVDGDVENKGGGGGGGGRVTMSSKRRRREERTVEEESEHGSDKGRDVLKC